MKKRMTLTISIVLLLAVLMSCMFGCGKDEPVDTVFRSGFKGLLVKPDFADMENKPVIDANTDMIDLATYLYDVANGNEVTVAQRMYYSTCPSENLAAGMNNVIDLDIVEIKSNNEYFRIDYRLKKDVPLFNIMPAMENTINNALELVVTERRYYDSSMSVAKYQKVKNASRDADGIPYADWSTIAVAKDEDVPSIFTESYQRCSHNINYDTIETANVTHNDEEGYYAVDLTIKLNVEIEYNNKNEVKGVEWIDGNEPEATLVTRKNVADGSGDENAKYYKLNIKFTVWDSGYYRSFEQEEAWFGNVVGSIAVMGSFHYVDQYSYDPEDCNIDTYPDASAAKAALKG